MQKIAALFALIPLAFAASPAVAQDHYNVSYSQRTVETQSWVEEWDPVQGRWVRVADEDVREGDAALPAVVTTITNGKAVTQTRSAARYARPAPSNRPAVALAQYGPFVVGGDNVARMVGATNSHSPMHFDAMLRDFPGIKCLEMVEAPGTSNDIANLALGRKIRAAGIATHVPRGGSVRSGAVELFLAGVTRTMEEGATFAVHSWLDNHGREADDFAPDHPAHRLYLDYYVEMGMSEPQAREFYAMTNSVPHSEALWLKADDMRGWIAPQNMTPHRYAAREVQAVCTFCKRVEESLARTNAQLAAWPFAPITLNPTANSKGGPVIVYSDLSDAKLADRGMSSLDS